MRVASILFVLTITSLAFSQDPALPPEQKPRFDIPPIPKLYPQTSPKAALESCVKALDKGRYDYVLAHIIEDSFVEGRIATKAKEIQDSVDKDLRVKREAQLANPARVEPGEKLSQDPKVFDIAVELESRARAFKLVLADIKDRFTEDPDAFKLLQKFAREAEFTETGDTAKATVRTIKDKVLHFKKVNGFWMIENKQSDK